MYIILSVCTAITIYMCNCYYMYVKLVSYYLYEQLSLSKCKAVTLSTRTAATYAHYVNCDDDNDYDDVPDDGVFVPVDKQVFGRRTISGQPALGCLELARRRDVVDEVLEVCRHVGLLPALVVEDETQLRLALVVEAAHELQRLSTHRPHNVQRPRDVRQ